MNTRGIAPVAPQIELTKKKRKMFPSTGCPGIKTPKPAVARRQKSLRRRKSEISQLLSAKLEKVIRAIKFALDP